MAKTARISESYLDLRDKVGSGISGLRTYATETFETFREGARITGQKLFGGPYSDPAYAVAQADYVDTAKQAPGYLQNVLYFGKKSGGRQNPGGRGDYASHLKILVGAGKISPRLVGPAAVALAQVSKSGQVSEAALAAALVTFVGQEVAWQFAKHLLKHHNDGRLG